MFGPRAGAAGSVYRAIGKNGDVSYCPKGQDSAAPSGLSDEDSRRQSLSEEFQPRWRNPGLSGQLETSPFLRLAQ